MARLAHATLLHYNLNEQPLAAGRVVTYRVMDAVISSMETVGPPIRMWVQHGVTFRELSTEESDAVGATVGAWKAIERESLSDQIFGSSPVLATELSNSVSSTLSAPATDIADNVAQSA